MIRVVKRDWYPPLLACGERIEVRGQTSLSSVLPKQFVDRIYVFG
jgi:hypothetical protein